MLCPAVRFVKLVPTSEFFGFFDFSCTTCSSSSCLSFLTISTIHSFIPSHSLSFHPIYLITSRLSSFISFPSYLIPNSGFKCSFLYTQVGKMRAVKVTTKSLCLSVAVGTTLALYCLTRLTFATLCRSEIEDLI